MELAAMPVYTKYMSMKGNTIPYPSIFDPMRRNYGFVSLVGRPSFVDNVPEAALSPALKSLLLERASKNSVLTTLGCDLGTHDRKYERLSRRFWAGEYVQLALVPFDIADRVRLQAIARNVEKQLIADVARDVWYVDFALCAAHIKIQDLIETEMLWLWFNAAASNRKVQSSLVRNS